jgi:hypothetical protein
MNKDTVIDMEILARAVDETELKLEIMRQITKQAVPGTRLGDHMKRIAASIVPAGPFAPSSQLMGLIGAVLADGIEIGMRYAELAKGTDRGT